MQLEGLRIVFFLLLWFSPSAVLKADLVTTLDKIVLKSRHPSPPFMNWPASTASYFVPLSEVESNWYILLCHTRAEEYWATNSRPLSCLIIAHRGLCPSPLGAGSSWSAIGRRTKQAAACSFLSLSSSGSLACEAEKSVSLTPCLALPWPAVSCSQSPQSVKVALAFYFFQYVKGFSNGSSFPVPTLALS